MEHANPEFKKFGDGREIPIQKQQKKWFVQFIDFTNTNIFVSFFCLFRLIQSKVIKTKS